MYLSIPRSMKPTWFNSKMGSSCHPRLVPGLTLNLTPQFCPSHRCYYYWAKGSKSPYSEHQLAASQDVVQEGEISGYLKEKHQKSSVSAIGIIIQAMQTLGNTREAEDKGWGELEQLSQG